MIRNAAERAVILIPSLEPDDRLPAYVKKLKEAGFAHIIVVDDGSGTAFRPIFEKAGTVEDTVVLYHEVNHGKGTALKTFRISAALLLRMRTDSTRYRTA